MKKVSIRISRETKDEMGKLLCPAFPDYEELIKAFLILKEHEDSLEL
ncbi:MAG: hypothetical protein WCT31_02090 [Candidatus Micrarchaeia archaeon]